MNLADRNSSVYPRLDPIAGLEPTEPFVTASEAGNFLELHPTTVQRLARQGLLPAHPVAGRKRKHWRFLRSELGAWLRARSCEGDGSI
jgi:excisionase family DNA binding protein